MKRNRLPDDVKAALARMIEGEAEPDDDVVVAEALRAHPEWGAQLRRQLEIDALLRLEGEPTAEAFMESVAARMYSSVGDEAVFIGRVLAALPDSARGDVGEANARLVRGGSFSWRSLASAAAGILVGMFCSSVRSAYVAPPQGKVLTLLQDGFESGAAPDPVGMPREVGKWSGDFTEITGEQRGVKPAKGQKMLRFLRGDYPGKANSDKSFISDIYQLVDVRGFLRDSGDGGAVACLSAMFDAEAFPEDQSFVGALALYALDSGSVSGLSGKKESTLIGESLAMSCNHRTRLDRDPTQWQQASVELRLPPNTEFLLVRIFVVNWSPSESRVTFGAHYLDEVRLTFGRRAPLL